MNVKQFLCTFKSGSLNILAIDYSKWWLRMGCMHIYASLHCKNSSILLDRRGNAHNITLFIPSYADVLITALEVFLSQKIGNTTTTKALTQISKNHEEGNVSYDDALKLKTAWISFDINKMPFTLDSILSDEELCCIGTGGMIIFMWDGISGQEQTTFNRWSIEEKNEQSRVTYYQRQS